MAIDITFDFRTDATGKNPDPDASSPTLLRYHHLLWSKPLPSGRNFSTHPAVAEAVRPASRALRVEAWGCAG
jgi:hypothetical protein